MGKVSVIVPAFNAAATLGACLGAIRAAADSETELLVVDDGSTDRTPELARTAGVRVLEQRRQGPAAARNAGVKATQGAVLLFVDSDVAVHPDAIRRMTATLEADPGLDGVFGSYDTTPAVKGIVGKYRNLLHAYTHQTGRTDATTFWAGLGAVRRKAFDGVGGFNSRRFDTASIEDIEFGMRLKAAGGRLLLDRSVLGTHCKEWTLTSMVQTDLWCRAVPWTRLLRQTGRMPNDLNLRWGQRLSVCAAWLLPPSLIAAAIDLLWLAGPAALVATHAALNLRFLSWVGRKAGLTTAFCALPLHLLFHWVAGLGYLIGSLTAADGETAAVTPRGAART